MFSFLKFLPKKTVKFGKWVYPDTRLELSKNDYKKIKNFCKKINPDEEQIMCYPYGHYNYKIIEKVSEYGFKAGFTTEVGDAILNHENAFKLKRYDTNDFPQ